MISGKIDETFLCEYCGRAVEIAWSEFKGEPVAIFKCPNPNCSNHESVDTTLPDDDLPDWVKIVGEDAPTFDYEE